MKSGSFEPFASHSPKSIKDGLQRLIEGNDAWICRKERLNLLSCLSCLICPVRFQLFSSSHGTINLTRFIYTHKHRKKKQPCKSSGCLCSLMKFISERFVPCYKYIIVPVPNLVSSPLLPPAVIMGVKQLVGLMAEGSLPARFHKVSGHPDSCGTCGLAALHQSCKGHPCASP